MTTHWQNIWSFKTRQFSVAYDVSEDDNLDLSWDDDGSVRDGLESGKYVAFQARVSVSNEYGDIIGADYLDECIYDTPQAFMDHRGINRHEGCGSHFSDMVREAIAEARKRLCRPRPYIRCRD